MTGFREVDLVPLRDAFLAGGESGADVARRLGWFDGRGIADTCRVQRALGVTVSYYTIVSGPRKGTRIKAARRTTSYDRAVMLARAIGVAPHEVGL